ncbi:NADPH oxidase organizer 1-like [Seriola lalandi dorsalis]|uniref:NADPH oxidase organizer 1b n=1 Tax=Seriola lalandi dorsalis TaxID=1841481 RepID=A0A3B4WNY6_SERLL|nr:NADPH oxidase organizer 1-like [Seriola lalandi dorsalis]
MAGEQRFVISARMIGGVHRDAPKLKMFMISVLWSDETEVIIYRSFQDFKKFHRQLKKKFPHMNPLRRNDRVIPKFRGKARRSSLQQKGSKKSVKRMKFLESYCNDLLKCDQTVTRSSEVTRFFLPKDQDLQPDFTKNSVMILLSDMSDGSDGGGGGVTGQHAGGITHPFVTQTYCCVAAYETKDTKNRPFKVAVDEKLDVLIKDPAGWWLVENEDKRLAWFPAPYLEVLEGEDDDDAGFQMAGALYCAVRSYSTKKDDEVSVAIGSVVEVLRKSDNGWWFIRFNGKAGYIPSMYLQPYNNPRAGLFSLQRKLHSSTLNLATSREAQASYQAGINEETNPETDSPGQSRGEPSVPGRLHKAQSLDVLSETWLQTEPERDSSTSDSRSRSRSNASNTSNASNASNTSVDSSLSGFSSSSESSLKDEAQRRSPSGLPGASVRRGSTTASESSASIRSDSSEGAPRMPPRPKTEEILTRCTTMTRKAALATKTRLHIQPESIQSR